MIKLKTLMLSVMLLIAGVATVVAAAGAVNLLSEYRVVPVVADTMDPAVPAGSLVVSKLVSEKDVAVGDVVIIGEVNQPTTMFGRVLETSTADGVYYNISLKGDNQTVPQVSPFKLNGMTYLVLFSVPVVGWVFAYLSSLAGFVITMLVVSVVAGVYVYGYHSPSLKPEPEVTEGRVRIPGTDEFYGGAEELKDLFKESRAA